jgi:hypothetical protein
VRNSGDAAAVPATAIKNRQTAAPHPIRFISSPTHPCGQNLNSEGRHHAIPLSRAGIAPRSGLKTPKMKNGPMVPRTGRSQELATGGGTALNRTGIAWRGQSALQYQLQKRRPKAPLWQVSEGWSIMPF